VTLSPVNGGDERADAREMSHFADGWWRTAVRLGSGRVLGLVHGTTGETAVELDDYGAPIPVSPRGLAIVRRVESDWPRIDDAVVGDLLLLADEMLPLRYWFAERLVAEGKPPIEMFAILPWELLDHAVEVVDRALRGNNAIGDQVNVRHWLTPAVRGLSGPVEQLDHGLRVGDPLIARLGASALLANLRDMPLSRIPERSRDALGRLVVLLGRLDPLYRHLAGIVNARLVATPEPVNRMRVELHSTLDAAAGGHGVREHTDGLGDADHGMSVVETRAGWVRVIVHVRQPDGPEGLLARRSGVFQPILLVPRDGRAAQRYWIGLYPEGEHLVGAITVALPKGWSVIDGDEPPVGAEELETTEPGVLLPSLHAGISPSVDRWLEIAETLPVNHPVRVAAKTFEDTL
jgi:hypothetical protein